MSNASDDIQAACSDTRPPMLDRTDYESWAQQIQLRTTNDGGVTLVLERPVLRMNLKRMKKKRFMADSSSLQTSGLQDLGISVYYEFERFKMIPSENITDYYVRFHKLVNDIRNIKMTMPNIQLNSKFVNNMTPEWDSGAHNRARNTNQGQVKLIKCYNCGGFGHIARNCTLPKRLQNSDYFKEKMILMQAQETRAVLDEEELLFLAGEQANTYDADVDDQPVQDLSQNDPNIFQADDCDAFDSDVDDEPTAQTIFMANLSSAVSSLQQAGPSNASILSEVLNLEKAIDHHEIPIEVQQSNIIDSDSVDMGNSNVIPYEHYVKHNEESVVPSGASSIQFDDYMLHGNSAYVPDDSITTRLNIYKE
ncbi:putative zinc finger, CCHC-type containing protein [Tanacetum coccineum]